MAEKKAQKLEKKTFFEVRVPMTSAKIYLYASSADSLVGKVVNLDLTRSLRGKSLELKAKIKKEGEELVGEPVSVILAGSYVRRMMRKGTDYVEDSFNAECREGIVVVKPFMITRNKVSRPIRNKLRMTAKDYILAQFKSRTSKEIITSIMTNKLQKEIAQKLKKIYPLAVCEIRWLEVVKVFDEEAKSKKEVSKSGENSVKTENAE